MEPKGWLHALYEARPSASLQKKRRTDFRPATEFDVSYLGTTIVTRKPSSVARESAGSSALMPPTSYSRSAISSVSFSTICSLLMSVTPLLNLDGGPKLG